MKKLLSAFLALTMCLSLAACSKNPEDLVFAVEAGSAGEAVALEKGYMVTSVPTQADALMEVQSGTSNGAIIDSLMASAMVGKDTSYPDLKIRDEKLTEELYVVGCRKGSDLASYINHAMSVGYEIGVMQELAEKYGVQTALVPQDKGVFFKSADYYSDVAYIRAKGTLVVGITEFAPMDYKDENGEWIGFDAECAKLVADQLNVEPQFVVIDWDRRLDELNSKNVDVLWNGMSLTNSAKETMEVTNAYCNNAQVIVTK